MRAEPIFRARSAVGLDALVHHDSFLILDYSKPLGNAVHASPVFEALRRAVPGAFIAVACSGMSFQVHQRNPFVQQIIKTSDPYRQPLGTAMEIRKAWRPPQGRTNCILTTVGSERSTIASVAWMAGKATRMGHTLLPEMFHYPLAYNADQSVLVNNLRLVEALGHGSAHYEPRVFFSSEELQSARSLLREHSLDDGRPIAILVTQTSRTQFKGWRKERFIAIANHLSSAHNCHIVFVGTAEEGGPIQEIQEEIGFPTVSLAGRTSIPVLSALLCSADIAVTLDTGIMHLGRAAQLPMSIIAPAWSPPIEWLPIGSNIFRVHKNADLPSMTPDYIIDEVSAEEVKTSVDEILRMYPPSQGMRSSRVARNLASQTIPIDAERNGSVRA